MQIILPKILARDEDKYPLFFLAGPVRGGGDWQHEMCLALERIMPEEFLVAIPSRYTQEHLLYPLLTDGETNAFDRQLLWERHYLELAAFRQRGGCVIFWLPEEDPTAPRTGDPYAMDTRGELGEWRGHMRYNSLCNVVVGAEKNFPGLSQISRNFDSTLGHPFQIFDSIDETANAAIKRVI